MARAAAVAENAALNGLAGVGNTNVIPFVSLHTGDPLTSGANENPSTGGYIRQACSWNAAAAGAMTNSSSLTFSTAGSTAVTHFGTYSASTAGTYALGGALASGVTAASITIAAGAISVTIT
jgi:hypothetical protein